MQPKGIPRYLGNTFSILSRQTLLKISEIFDIVRSKFFKMVNKMTVQEVLDEIMADQDSGDSDFEDESGDFFIANCSALTHVYPVHAHRCSETESEGSDLAPVSDVEIDVNENYQDFTHTQNPLKLGVK